MVRKQLLFLCQACLGSGLGNIRLAGARTKLKCNCSVMHNSETLLKKWYCSHSCTIQAHTGLGIVQIQQNWTRNSKFQWKVDCKHSGLQSVPNQRLKLAPSPDLVSYFWSLYYVLFWFWNFSVMELFIYGARFSFMEYFFSLTQELVFTK